MSEQTANHHVDDFITDFSDRHPTQAVRDLDSASAGDRGPSQQSQPQQQFLFSDFDEVVQPPRPEAHHTGGDHFGGDSHKYASSKTADLLGDFLERERGGDPPAPPTFDVKAEINVTPAPAAPPAEAAQNLIDNLQDKDNFAATKEEDFGPIQPDYLNPYASSKLESNEKFISTDDLIGLSDNEGKDTAFEDCDKEEDLPPPFVADSIKEPEPVFTKPAEPVKTETVAAAAAKVEPPKPEPAKPEPVKPVEPVKPAAPAKIERPKQEPPKKPVEPLEAEKLFKRFGLGKSQILIYFLTIFDLFLIKKV